MSTSLSIREKTTDGIIMQLLTNGSAIDLTDMTKVDLYMIDSKRKVYRYSTSDDPAYLEIYDATNGKVEFTPPDATIFQYSRTPYKLHFWVYTSATEKYSVPEDDDAIINVRREF